VQTPVYGASGCKEAVDTPDSIPNIFGSTKPELDVYPPDDENAVFSLYLAANVGG